MARLRRRTGGGAGVARRVAGLSSRAVFFRHAPARATREACLAGGAHCAVGARASRGATRSWCPAGRASALVAATSVARLLRRTRAHAGAGRRVARRILRAVGRSRAATGAAGARSDATAARIARHAGSARIPAFGSRRARRAHQAVAATAVARFRRRTRSRAHVARGVARHADGALRRNRAPGVDGSLRSRIGTCVLRCFDAPIVAEHDDAAAASAGQQKDQGAESVDRACRHAKRCSATSSRVKSGARRCAKLKPEELLLRPGEVARNRPGSARNQPVTTLPQCAERCGCGIQRGRPSPNLLQICGRPRLLEGAAACSSVA
jgi:hypothetical protein